MKFERNYIITTRTVLLYPEFDGFGNLYTRAFDDKGIFKVKMSPSELIDFNLKYYGSSLRGACDGSGMILGNIKMHPIVINEKLGLYWFPSTSPTRKDCVWFALHHIESYKPSGEDETLILFNNESTLVIDMSCERFEKRVARTFELKGKVGSRARKMTSEVREPETLYHISKGKNDRNYDIKEE